MRLEYRLGDAEERRAADLTAVHERHEALELGLDKQIAELGAQTGQEYLLDAAAEELCRALDGLEHDVSGESVGDRDITAAEHDVIALDVADEVDASLVSRLLEHRIGLLAQRVTLGVLRAVVDQADARICHTDNLLHVEASHKRKLKQILRRALDVGARVDEQDLAGLGREQGRQCGSADAADALDNQRRARQLCTGVSSGYQCVALAVRKHAECDRHGGILLAAQDTGRIVVHIDDLLRVAHRDRQSLRLLLLQQIADDVLLADQNVFLTELLCRHDTAGYQRLRGVVTAHGIDNQFHFYRLLIDGCPPSARPAPRVPAGRSVYSSPACP